MVLLNNRNIVIGAALTAIFVTLALVSFVYTPYDVTGVDIPNKLKKPFSNGYPLGTDHFGRDILSMIMVGARTSIAVALVAVTIGMALGVPLGLAAAANKGYLLDELIMRSNDLIFAFPSLVIAQKFYDDPRYVEVRKIRQGNSDGIIVQVVGHEVP